VALVPVGMADGNPILDTDDETEYRQEWQASLSCQFYGDGAHGYAVAAVEALDKVAVQDKFRAVYCAIQSTSGLNDLAAVIDSEYEQRWQFDVFMSFAGSVIEELYWIDNLKDAEYKVYNEAGTLIVEGTFDVP